MSSPPLFTKYAACWESVGPVEWRVEKTGDPTVESNVHAGVEADVAGLECCTRHNGSKARTKTGEMLDG